MSKRLIRKGMGKENLTDTIKFKTTPGVGDFMMALNIAHFRSFILERPINLEFHWYHDKNFLYHFEDPETIFERFKYLNKFYEKKNTEVKIKHIFNSDYTELWSTRYKGLSRNTKRYPGSPMFKINDWLFRKDIRNVPIDEHKIVLWRPTFNAQDPRSFKMPMTAIEWLELIQIIEVNGYHVVEIDYRTPIREVLYHISTARACVSYEGMWHYIGRNLNKPMIVLSADPITHYHTPDAFIYNPREMPGFDPAKGHKPVFKPKYFYNFDKRLQWADDAANARIGYLKEMLYEN